MNVFTIPAGAPFVDALARGLIARCGTAPEALAPLMVLLPTRRACRALAEAFLRAADGAALILPRMVPLGDIDDDATLIEAPFAAPDLPPAMPTMRRQVLLTGLVQEFARASSRTPPLPAQAVRLAAELAGLVDQVATERLSFERLATLVPDEYARHWQQTLNFLTIVTEAWPKVLEAEGMIDAATRRDLVLARQAQAWAERPPAHPVIAAGSTGTIPGTAELLHTIARLPKGEVVLPGFDRALEPDALRHIGPTHPQYGMVQLIARMGLKPADVRAWTDAHESPRVRAIAAALHPVDAEPRAVDDAALHAARAVERVECAGPQEEAATIALILRAALETPGKTAALVTPDRDLARRVGAELRRWDIEVDDSGGQPLGATPPGVFLRLTARLAGDASRTALLAALKHPLAAGGLEPGGFRAKVRACEIALRKGQPPDPELIDMVRPMRDARGRVPVRTLLDAHLRFAEDLAASADQRGAERLWAGDAGEVAAEFAAEFADAANHLAPIDARDYAGLLESLMDGYVVRPRYGLHPRLKIWGLLEARLQHADLLVLGGLNEGSWPIEPTPDAWMSRPMRKDFGLPPLERRIGLAAHDFVQAFSAPQVVVTRATRHSGAPTVPSRFVARLDALLADENRARPPWADWQALLDRPARLPRPQRRPEPAPAVAARPRQLSVTEIETWLRDPYAIYAKHVLRLRPLDPLDVDPGAAERGTVIHRALDAFLRAHADALPADAEARLIEAGRRAFGSLLDEPAVYAFWWPRFLRVARWFVDIERDRRPALAHIATEVSGKMAVGDFTLTAKADRIDRLRSGALAIVDYKTGGLPAKKDIERGFAPQLPLEAVMALAGGFEGVAAAPVASLAYWRMTGARQAGEVVETSLDPATLAKEAEAGLRTLIALFADAQTSYPSQPDLAHAPRYSDYAHLARVREWSAGGPDEP